MYSAIGSPSGRRPATGVAERRSQRCPRGLPQPSPCPMCRLKLGSIPSCPARRLAGVGNSPIGTQRLVCRTRGRVIMSGWFDLRVATAFFLLPIVLGVVPFLLWALRVHARWALAPIDDPIRRDRARIRAIRIGPSKLPLTDRVFWSLACLAALLVLTTLMLDDLRQPFEIQACAMIGACVVGLAAHLRAPLVLRAGERSSARRLHELLRLGLPRVCPDCHQSLGHLPLGGNCPGCGLTYASDSLLDDWVDIWATLCHGFPSLTAHALKPGTSDFHDRIVLLLTSTDPSTRSELVPSHLLHWCAPARHSHLITDADRGFSGNRRASRLISPAPLWLFSWLAAVLFLVGWPLCIGHGLEGPGGLGGLGGFLLMASPMVLLLVFEKCSQRALARLQVVITDMPRVCPECFASLRESPEQGACPQCGQAYTAQSLIDDWVDIWTVASDRRPTILRILLKPGSPEFRARITTLLTSPSPQDRELLAMA